MAPSTTPRFYSIDGNGVNPLHAAYGAVNTLYGYISTSNGYADNRSEALQSGRASTRRISTVLGHLPFRWNTKANANALFPSFGQLLTHDISSGADRTGPWMNITVDRCDSLFDPQCTGTATIAFRRQGGPTDDHNVQRAINANTAWIDGSVLYGHDTATLAALRTGSGGQLMTSQSADEQTLLTFKTGYGFVSGDTSVNNNPPLLLLETLFYLEHNHIASALYQQHPGWDDDTLFNEARRLLIAIYQKVTYKEYLPRLLGHHLQEYAGFVADLDPAIDIAFITGAMRYGHSAMNSRLPLLGEDWHPTRDGVLTITDISGMFRELRQYGMGPLLRGLMTLPEANVDLNIIAELSSIGNPRIPGLYIDLIADDLQRGRDLGAPPYNKARQALGLAQVQSWEQLTSDTLEQAALAQLYDSVDDVDLLVGGLAENDPTHMLGATFDSMITEQFTRLRDADPLYYERPGLFTEAELAAIEARTLSQMIVDHTSVRWMPADAFALQIAARSDGTSAAVQSTRQTLTPLSGLQISWVIDNDFWDVKLTSTLGGWVGVGFGDTMTGADVVLGYVDPKLGSVVVDCTVSTTYDYVAAPVADDTVKGCGASLDLGATVTLDSGLLTVRFRRALNTGDHCDHVIQRGETAMIFAHGTSQTPVQHGHMNRVQAKVDLFSTLDQQFLTVGTANMFKALSGASAFLHVLAFIAVLVYRKHRLVIVSAPILLALSGVGYLLLDGFVFLTSLRQTTNICLVRLALLCIGSTLVITTALHKLYRFYQIFGNSTTVIVVIRNSKLTIATLVYVFMDVVCVALIVLLKESIGPTIDNPNRCVAGTTSQSIFVALFCIQLVLSLAATTLHCLLSSMNGRTLSEFQAEINAEGYTGILMLLLLCIMGAASALMNSTNATDRIPLTLSGCIGITLALAPFLAFSWQKRRSYVKFAISRGESFQRGIFTTPDGTQPKSMISHGTVDTKDMATISESNVIARQLERQHEWDQARAEWVLKSKSADLAAERLEKLRLQILRSHQDFA